MLQTLVSYPFIASLIVAVIAGYLAGSIMTALIVCRLCGLPDPGTYGSRNPGATNVARRSIWGGALTVAGDMGKAAIPMFALYMAGFSDSAVILCGVSAFIGHIFPLSIRKERKGGKGVATFLGFLVLANGMAALLFAATWLLVFAVTRYSAAAGVTASVLAPVFAWIHHDLSFESGGSPLVLTMACMAGLIVWRHRHDFNRTQTVDKDRNGAEPDA